MQLKRLLLPALAVLVCALLAIPAGAQSLVSGDVTGLVTDPTGAVLPSVTVTLKNNATGAAQTQTTNAQGVYRFALLPPGDYTVYRPRPESPANKPSYPA